MLILLDASALINQPAFTFEESERYACTYEVLEEFRSMETRALVENALKRKLLRVYRPKHKYLNRAKKLVRSKGFTKMSKADISTLALAMQFKEQNKEFLVITDDYSIQNFLAMLAIPFASVMQGKIKNIISFVRFCPVCKKEYAAGSSVKECPDCGVELRTKRIIEKSTKNL